VYQNFKHQKAHTDKLLTIQYIVESLKSEQTITFLILHRNLANKILRPNDYVYCCPLFKPTTSYDAPCINTTRPHCLSAEENGNAKQHVLYRSEQIYIMYQRYQGRWMLCVIARWKQYTHRGWQDARPQWRTPINSSNIIMYAHNCQQHRATAAVLASTRQPVNIHHTAARQQIVNIVNIIHEPTS
jgi:hypothetical protein